jgi:hypothetical protein
MGGLEKESDMLKSRGMALSLGLLFTLLACVSIIAGVALHRSAPTPDLSLNPTLLTRPIVKSLWVTLPTNNSAAAPILSGRSSDNDQWVNKSELNSDALDATTLNAAVQGALHAAPRLLLNGDTLAPSPLHDTFSSAPSLCPADAYRHSSAINGM